MREANKTDKQAVPSAGAAREPAEHTRTTGCVNDGIKYNNLRYTLDVHGNVCSYWSPIPIGFRDRAPTFQDKFNPYRSNVTRFGESRRFGISMTCKDKSVWVQPTLPKKK